MNKGEQMTLIEKIETMEAFERGEGIECNSLWNQKWTSTTAPAWNWNDFCYRVVPKPKQVVVIEKWLLQKEGTQQFAIEEGNSVEMAVWDKSSFKKVKLIDTYEVEI